MSLETASEGSFGHLARAASKMMDQMQKGFFVVTPETWTPNVNLYETAVCYFVCVDLAGVEKDKIDIEVVDQQLTLRGCRVVPSPDSSDLGDLKSTAGVGAGVDECSTDVGSGSESVEEPSARRSRVHVMEIDHGTFSRNVELPPDADQANIAATYRNGLLWIQIPKR